MNKDNKDSKDKKEIIEGLITFLKESPDFKYKIIEDTDLFHVNEVSLVENMKTCINNLSDDVTFMEQDYKLQIDNEEYTLDLLYYCPNLQRILAFKIFTSELKPEHMEKMDLCLKALDKKEKREFDNESIGILQCPYIDQEVVETTMTKITSPMAMSTYVLLPHNVLLLDDELLDFLTKQPTIPTKPPVS